jgi:type I restriction enzyme M protein
MPEKLFFNTGIPVSLWFVAKNRANSLHRDRRGTVLFIDARKLGRMDTRTVRILDSVDIARVANTYHAWRDSGVTPEYADVPGFCRAASLADIAEHDFVLTPGRYVGVPDATLEAELPATKLLRLRAELVAEFREGDRLAALIDQRLSELLDDA